MENQNPPRGDERETAPIREMYKNYFLDYASYVILERAVPMIEDGLKPVQRRILYSMHEIEDGRYHKVANIIGHTMQYHPHGDAAIGDALVNIGQKDLMIDCQGNWGDIRTGDSAAAPRYIEARLSKFALEVGFNPKITDWQMSYDGRKREPVNLPMKFPLVLAQGAEGIAVGLSTRIMPHNFIELCRASIHLLQGKPIRIYPDFQTGGFVDVSQYKGGKRGGKIRVRAKIEKIDKKTLSVTELPFSMPTGQLIESIVKASEKGKIKIKKIVDNTAKNVEILIELNPGISPDVTMDALYAFTNCEVSISTNACIILDNKPVFTSVNEILKYSTQHTVELLRQELEIEMAELEEKWHLASLEKIFIENKVYREIEECETWQSVIQTIDSEMRKYIVTPSMEHVPGDTRIQLRREMKEDDIVKLTEIKIKRISKYNKFKADELIVQIETGIEKVQFHLDHLTDYAIDYFQNILEKYHKGRERKTEIRNFDDIEAAKVVAKTIKLYADEKEGFVGFGLKKDKYICDCSDIDDIIVIREDGKMIITKIADKTFVGKRIRHVSVWEKGDERTTYNLIYSDGSTGKSYAKRFQVTSITRDKEYDLTGGTKGTILYLTANPNGESEVVTIKLSSSSKARKKIFDFDFAELAIKGRSAKGNIVSRYSIKTVTQKEIGKSTLGAIKVWMDSASGRLNTEERGVFIGSYDTGDSVLVIYRDGTYETTEMDLNNKYDASSILSICKYRSSDIINAIYYDGEKDWTMVKRFQIETSTNHQRFCFISEHKSSRLYHVDLSSSSKVEYTTTKNQRDQIHLGDFIDVKGWKALGNKLCDGKLRKVESVVDEDDEEEHTDQPVEKLSPGDSVDFDLDPQGTLFDLNE